MYQLVVVEGKPATQAARLVAQEICPPDIKAHDRSLAEDRIRKDFKRWRPDLEKGQAACAKLEEPKVKLRSLLPTARQLQEIREAFKIYNEFLKSPHGKAQLRNVTEMGRWESEYKFALDTLARAGAFDKVMGWDSPITR